MRYFSDKQIDAFKSVGLRSIVDDEDTYYYVYDNDTKLVIMFYKKSTNHVFHINDPCYYLEISLYYKDDEDNDKYYISIYDREDIMSPDDAFDYVMEFIEDDHIPHGFHHVKRETTKNSWYSIL